MNTSILLLEAGERERERERERESGQNWLDRVFAANVAKNRFRTLSQKSTYPHWSSGILCWNSNTHLFFGSYRAHTTVWTIGDNLLAGNLVGEIFLGESNFAAISKFVDFRRWNGNLQVAQRKTSHLLKIIDEKLWRITNWFGEISLTNMLTIDGCVGNTGTRDGFKFQLKRPLNNKHRGEVFLVSWNQLQNNKYLEQIV